MLFRVGEKNKGIKGDLCGKVWRLCSLPQNNRVSSKPYTLKPKPETQHPEQKTPKP